MHGILGRIRKLLYAHVGGVAFHVHGVSYNSRKGYIIPYAPEFFYRFIYVIQDL